MTLMLKESQVWAALAEEYERGHSNDVSLTGLCVSLSGLYASDRIGLVMKSLCYDRLRARFRPAVPRAPRWWQFWKKEPASFLPYYWDVGDMQVRAEACDALFYDAQREESL